MHGLFDRVQRRAQFLGDAGDATARQALQRAVDDAQGQGAAWRVCGQCRQLQPQAFAQAARGHAHRVHALHLVQHGQDLVHPGGCFRQQGLGDGLQWLAQVAVLVQGIDQRRADAAVAWGQMRQVQLPEQVVGQGFRLGHALGRVFAVIGVAATAAGAVPAAFVRCPVLTVLAPAIADLLVAGGAGRLASAGLGRGVVGDFLGPLQQRVGLDLLGDLGLQFQAGHLQQADGLAQLRRHGQVLSLRCLQPCLHVPARYGAKVSCGPGPGVDYRRNASPR